MSTEDIHPYVKLARLSATRHLSGDHAPPAGIEVDSDTDIWNIKRACFVSIKTLRGDLRGCIGTILPSYPTIDREIAENAVSASTRDPRFPPMRSGELNGVTFSVDVLTLPEPVTDTGELDPKIWGVIVSKGYRRGVLLPDLEGVDSVRQQLEIAAGKAGIYDMSGVRIERFRVDRYKET